MRVRNINCDKPPGKLIFYLGFSLLGLFVALILHVNRYETINPGTQIPELTFEGKMGKELLIHDFEKTTIIIWFHPDCGHCLYQLTQLNAYIDLLKDTKFFFLTAEKNFPSTRHLGLWPNLTSANNVRFGIVEKEKFSASFGKVITPTTFIFDKRGRLIEKIYGEVKVQKIQHVLEDVLTPDHSDSRDHIN